MHEFALAEGVVQTALEAAERGKLKKIERVAVVIGELQQIEKELFAEAITRMMPAAHEQLAGADIELRIEAAEFGCRACGRRFGFGETRTDLEEAEAEAIHFIPELAHTYLRCPGCASPDFEVTRGRGVWLEAVEGVQ